MNNLCSVAPYLFRFAEPQHFFLIRLFNMQFWWMQNCLAVSAQLIALSMPMKTHEWYGDGNEIGQQYWPVQLLLRCSVAYVKSSF